MCLCVQFLSATTKNRSWISSLLEPDKHKCEISFYSRSNSGLSHVRFETGKRFRVAATLFLLHSLLEFQFFFFRVPFFSTCSKKELYTEHRRTKKRITVSDVSGGKTCTHFFISCLHTFCAIFRTKFLISYIFFFFTIRSSRDDAVLKSWWLSREMVEIKSAKEMKMNEILGSNPINLMNLQCNLCQFFKFLFILELFEEFFKQT